MGGYGSGRTGYKQKAEDCRSIDVNKMHRADCFHNGRRGSWVWSQDGERVASIGYSFDLGQLSLNYRVRIHCGDWEGIKQTIPLVWSDCNYGGQRPYFRCPGVVNGIHCQRRVGKLFTGGRFFLCRHCYSIGYTSQSEARYDRNLRRANHLRRALGGHAGTAHCIAPRPKGMWHRTYQRKVWEIQHDEHNANVLFVS